MTVSKTRFVLVSFTYPPVLGGSEVEAQRVTEALRARGHRARVLCAGGPPMPPITEWTDECGIPVRIMASGSPPRLKGHVFAWAVAWRLFKERRDYDVAYFLMHGMHVALGLPVARLLGKPIVMKFSGSSLMKQMMGSFTGRMQIRMLRNWAARILVLNPGMEEEAREVGLRAEQISWMPNPVDVNWFHPATPEEKAQLRLNLGLDSADCVVVFLGRLDYAKEIPRLLGAFARVVHERPQAKLALVGDGPLGPEMKQLAASLGIEKRIVFTGRLPMTGVRQWLQASDIFALVSAVEGLPCSLLEAMAVGLPSVLSRIPAHTQVVEDGVDGVLIEQGNEESIARGIVNLIDAPEKRAEMGLAARRKVEEQYATSKVAEHYERLFAEILSTRK